MKFLTVLGAVFAFSCATLIPLKVSESLDIQVEITPERVEAGRYLADNVMLCNHCHSEVDWDYYGGYIPEETLGGGGESFNEWFGVVYGTNVTPAALSDWTDSEIAQAITEGVHKSGKSLFPVMPYPTYRTLAEEDLMSLIAYLRSMKPVENSLPPKKLKFPFKYIERTIPAKYAPSDKPDPENTVEYGKYLATMGDCIRCHTPFDNKGNTFEDQLFRGGNKFNVPVGIEVYSTNISSDPDDGIGLWTKEDFIELFKERSEPEKVAPELNTIMAWQSYSGMKEGDLGAIYDFIMSSPPMKSKSTSE